MNFSSKKGLSPVIATVLLISLGIALSGIVFLWMVGFVSEQIQKQGKPIEQVCKDVSFENEQTYNDVGNSITLQVTNRGNVHIYGFDIKFIESGESNMKSFTFDVPIGEASDVQIIPILGENVKEVVLYPMILGSVRGKKLNKPVTCLDSGKIIQLE